MEVNQKVAADIRQKMKQRGMTQAQLGEQTGISQPNLSRMLSGRSPRVPDTLRRVLDELGLELTVAEKDAEEVGTTTGTSTLRSVLETPDSEFSPEDTAWLEAFLDAAKGQSASAAPYASGSVVIVQFDRQQVRPCVTLTRAKTAQASKVCGIVPLAPPLERPVGELTCSFKKSEGILPASSIALCTQVQTVKLEQVTDLVSKLNSARLRAIKDAVTELLTLNRAGDGGYIG